MQREFKLKVSGVAGFNGTVTVLAENAAEAVAEKTADGIGSKEIAQVELTYIKDWQVVEAEGVYCSDVEEAPRAEISTVPGPPPLYPSSIYSHAYLIEQLELNIANLRHQVIRLEETIALVERRALQQK